ncbi:MAG: hypothetical protein J7M34_03485 [Anaerolineae bacterium]|nr:hypothetical protein [Anaerolineae bacterium]
MNGRYGRYMVVAGRIRQELTNLDYVVARAQRAMTAVRQRLEKQDLSADSIALNLHDFYHLHGTGGRHV